MDEVPTGTSGPIWVHCAGGYRAAVVAALLAANGRDVVAVDDNFDNAAPSGVPTVTSMDQEAAQ
jgi:rhodanese-related sulfurtransferase